jgi:hypothetical protein
MPVPIWRLEWLVVHYCGVAVGYGGVVLDGKLCWFTSSRPKESLSGFGKERRLAPPMRW